ARAPLTASAARGTWAKDPTPFRSLPPSATGLARACSVSIVGSGRAWVFHVGAAHPRYLTPPRRRADGSGKWLPRASALHSGRAEAKSSPRLTQRAGAGRRTRPRTRPVAARYGSSALGSDRHRGGRRSLSTR